MADLRTTIFVGNLSVFCGERDIEQVFSRFGQILEIRMAKSEDRSKHLSYGFIKFANIASAQLATLEMDGKILCGRPLKIGKALSRSNRRAPVTKGGGGSSNGLQQYDTASVHVTFISNQVYLLVTEESLRSLFVQFGEVVDAVICKSNVDQRTKKQSGYGFIHYPGTPEGIKASFKAADLLKDIVIDDVHYKCKISHQLEHHLLRHSVDDLDRSFSKSIALSTKPRTLLSSELSTSTVSLSTNEPLPTRFTSPASSLPSAANFPVPSFEYLPWDERLSNIYNAAAVRQKISHQPREEYAQRSPRIIGGLSSVSMDSLAINRNIGPNVFDLGNISQLKTDASGSLPYQDNGFHSQSAFLHSSFAGMLNINESLDLENTAVRY